MKCQVAKKEHKCNLCHKPIKKGERYWRDFIDGVRDHKEHTNCAEHETLITANEKGSE